MKVCNLCEAMNVKLTVISEDSTGIVLLCDECTEQINHEAEMLMKMHQAQNMLDNPEDYGLI